MLISSWSINKHSRHRQFLFLIGRFLKIFSSEIAWSNDPKLGRMHVWEVIYKDYSCRPDPLTDMTTTGDSFFWLADFYILPLWNRLAKCTEAWYETDRFLNNHCQECVRAYRSIHDCLSFLRVVMIGNHRTKTFLHEVMIGNHRNKTTES